MSFNIEYGSTDSLKVINVFNNKYLLFKTELIDVNKNTLAVLDSISFNKNLFNSYNKRTIKINSGYQNNILVNLKITVSNNINPLYTMVDKFDIGDVLAKENISDLTLNDLNGIKEYDLLQNYPNPFNPVTTIKFQIPKEGYVVLKVYDILGREVRTLVNDYKPIGKYSIDFNASSLASGTYIYELRVNDFKAVKKFILLK